MKLEVRERSADYHVQLEGHPELWDCGRSAEEAVDNWLLTHGSKFNDEELAAIVASARPEGGRGGETK